MAKKKKYSGHYCRICGRNRPNEKFSGNGHRIHICKDCARELRNMKYNPEKSPNAEEWLSTDEGERMYYVTEYHGFIGEDLPNMQLHSAIHAIVENQIAMEEEIPVKTLERLMKEGLSRHDAIHAIGTVLSKQIYNVMADKPSSGNVNDPYMKELKSLTAKKWRKFGQ